MNQLAFLLLSLVIFLPLFGAVVTLFLRKDTAIKWWALIVTVANFIISLPLYFYFQSGPAEMQFVEHIPWMPELGVSYYLGIDGISLFLVLLTTFLTPVAVLSFLGGYMGLPHFLGGSAVEGFLSPVFAAEEGAHAAEAGAHAAGVGLEVTFLFISVVVALAGIGLAYFMYVARPTVPVALARRLGPLYKLPFNKYYVDELYTAVVVNPLKGLAGWLARIFDARGIDGLVNGVACATRALASLSADVFDPKILDGLVNGIAAFFGWSGQTTRKVQTGSVRNYALSILLGVVVLVGYFVLR